jgi:diacylglycerol kinase (ATP)
MQSLQDDIKIKKVHIIINPASGQGEPVLPLLNKAMQESQMKWEVFITKKSGDAMAFAKEAIAAKVDAILVYGGDGTLMEVTRGVMGTEMPVGILPGGTANVIAADLGIPNGLKEALDLICEGPHTLKKIDIGKFEHTFFISRLGLGFEAEIVKGADRSSKNRVGVLAYTISAIKAFRKVKLVCYKLKIDNKEFKVKGLTCIIANSGSTGMSNLTLANNIDLSDGLLDVLVVKRASIGLIAYTLNTLLKRKQADRMELVKHWQGKEIFVTASPSQTAQCDGEILGKKSLHAKIIPQALNVIVPKNVSS